MLIFYCKESLKQFQNEIKEQKGGFLGTLLGYLGDCLLGNMLLEKKGTLRAGYGNKKRKGILRNGYGSKKF